MANSSGFVDLKKPAQFGAFIAAQRNILGVSQREAHAGSGISLVLWNQVETGKVSRVRRGNLAKIEAYLQLQENDLYFFNETGKEPESGLIKPVSLEERVEQLAQELAVAIERIEELERLSRRD